MITTSHQLDSVLASRIGFGKYQMIQLIYCCFAYAILSTDILLFILLVPEITREFHFTDIEISWIFSMSALVSFCAGHFWGFLSDRFGRKISFLLAGMISTLAQTLMATTQSKTLVVLSRLLAGFGICGLSILVYVIYVEFLPKTKREKPFLLLFASGSIGFILDSFIAWKIFPIFGWRSLPIVITILLLTLTIVGSFTLDESARFLLVSERYNQLQDLILKMIQTNCSIDTNLLIEEPPIIHSDEEIPSSHPLYSQESQDYIEVRRSSNESLDSSVSRCPDVSISKPIPSSEIVQPTDGSSVHDASDIITTFNSNETSHLLVEKRYSSSDNPENNLAIDHKRLSYPTQETEIEELSSLDRPPPLWFCCVLIYRTCMDNIISHRTNRRVRYSIFWKNPDLSNLLFYISLMWIFNSLGYWGISLFLPEYLKELGLHPFEATFYAQFASILGTVIFLGLSAKYSRLILLRITTVICFISFLLLAICIATHVLQTWIVYFSMILYYSGIAPLYALLFLFSSETFPTQIRSTGMGIVNSMVIIPSIIIPFISQDLLPYPVFFAVAWGICYLLLLITTLKFHPDILVLNLDYVEATYVDVSIDSMPLPEAI